MKRAHKCDRIEEHNCGLYGIIWGSRDNLWEFIYRFQNSIGALHYLVEQVEQVMG